MEWAIFGSAFSIIFLLIVFLGDHLRQKRKIMLREIQQKERIAAMEKGLALPEINDDIFDEVREVISGPEQFKNKMRWFRVTLLAIGLFLVFGGLGMFLGFHFAADPEFGKMSTLAAIPFMTGLGLLLFYFLTGKDID